MGKKKIGYFALNLMAPGIAQLVMKKWIRGSIQLIGALACCVWMLVAFVHLIIGNMDKVMNGQDMDLDMSPIITSSLLLILIWIYSYIDLIFFCKVKEKEAERRKAEERELDEEMQKKIREEVARGIAAYKEGQKK